MVDAKVVDWELVLPVATLIKQEQTSSEDGEHSGRSQEEFIVPDMEVIASSKADEDTKDWICGECGSSSKAHLADHMTRHNDKNLSCCRATQHTSAHNEPKSHRQDKNRNLEEIVEEVVIFDVFINVNNGALVEEEDKELMEDELILPCNIVSSEVLLMKENDCSSNCADNSNSKFNYNSLDEEKKNGELNKVNEIAKTAKSSKKLDKTQSNKSKKKNKCVCEQCGIGLPSLATLDEHLRRHKGDKRYLCELCPDRFIRPGDLKRHMAKHTGDFEYFCNYCDRNFLDKSTLMKHERTHTNERPFVCPLCGKAFTVSNILTAHMLSHSGERPFKCEPCNMSFKRKTHLVTHNRSKTHQQNEAKQPQTNAES